MKTFQLRNDVPDLLPRSGDDDGRRVLKVYLLKSATLIREIAQFRGHNAHAQRVRDAWEITIDCTKAQFEEIRAEFNGRPHR